MRSKIAAEAVLVHGLDGLLEANRLTKRERALRPLVGKVEAEIAKGFLRQGELFLRRFAKLKPRILEVTVPRDWLFLWQEVAGETLRFFVDPLELFGAEALLAGGSQFISSIGIADLAFGLENPRAIAYLDQFAGLKVTKINAETQRQLATLIQNSAREGGSYDALAKAIRERFEGFANPLPQGHIQSRAHLVAVTEMGEAYEAAARMGVQDLQAGGLQMEKSWSTVGDGKVSDGCRQNEAEGWIPTNQVHGSGHMHPLRFPGCRCAEKYRRRRAA
ncbi:MAG: hypothetical protein DWQ07_14115 [Chloroflexi bacterium]|nr:MAG: hypothetical protein DWQ07_14115 [Chloroflexota bacterium]